jgi:hypothetical protein
VLITFARRVVGARSRHREGSESDAAAHQSRDFVSVSDGKMTANCAFGTKPSPSPAAADGCTVVCGETPAGSLRKGYSTGAWAANWRTHPMLSATEALVYCGRGGPDCSRNPRAGLRHDCPTPGEAILQMSPVRESGAAAGVARLAALSRCRSWRMARVAQGAALIRAPAGEEPERRAAVV